MKSNLLLTLRVPHHPFLRAYTWTEGGPQTARPLHFGVCLCPYCRYAGVEADFRDGAERNYDIRQTLRRLFVDQSIGSGPPLSEIIGSDVESLEEPERSTRLYLAAIATQRLVYPELWRRREIGQLYLRLAWLYVDELHLRWDPSRPTAPPVFEAAGPGSARMREVLSALERVRATWPQVPLDEEATRREVLRFHQEAYTRRADTPSPEESVADERLLAILFGLNDDREKAKEMFERALNTCFRLRQEATDQQSRAWESGLTATETKALATRIQRLTKSAESIKDEMNAAFAPPKPKVVSIPQPRKTGTAPPDRKKRIFGIFG
jgi:hypothetical protein